MDGTSVASTACPFGAPEFMSVFNGVCGIRSIFSFLSSVLTTILPILFLYLNTVTVTAGTFEP